MHGVLVSKATRQSPTQVLLPKRLNKDPRRRTSPHHQDLIATSLRLGGQKAEESPTNPSQACQESVVPPHPPPSPKAVLGETDEPPEVSARTKIHEELPGSGRAVCAGPNVTDSRVLNQVPEPESKIVAEIRDDPLDLNVQQTAAAAEQAKDDVPSSAALLDDPSPAATESEDDPYREPKAIPKHRPPVFVYPHSEGKISPKFRQRFREVVNIFMYNIRGSAELRESTQFIDYTLRICGQSPETSHPSILVFCRQRDFKPLHGLLSNDRLRFQYCRKRSSRRDLWSGWPASRRPAATTTDQNVPFFDLYFWRSLQPRELLWGPRSTVFLDQGPSTGITSYLTMCGSLLMSPNNMEKRSTLGYVVQLGPDYYGVTASHTFRSAEDEPKRPVARGESTHYNRSAVPAEHNNTVLTSGGSTYSDDWIGQQTETLQIDTSDDSEEYLVDDGEYESFTDEESDTEHVIGGARKEKGVWQMDWERNETPVVYFPQLAEHELLGELDLDWALVKLEDADNWRPNAVMTKNGTDVIFLTEFASEYPERETPVLIATSGGAQFSGNLCSIPSVLGGVYGRVPSVMGTVTLDDDKLLSKGDSGSVVVDALTNRIFGHVVASNPLGEVYVSPVIGLLDQLEARYRGFQVRLPEPLSTLKDLISLHFSRRNTVLVDRLTPHVEKLQKDSSVSASALIELWQAEILGDVELLKSLIQQGISVHEKFSNGQTALHSASETGRLDVVRLLLDEGADLDAKDFRGRTPLHDASRNGDPEAVKLLLERGACLEMRDVNGRTPLHNASATGDLEVVRLLIEIGADLDVKDFRGRTPLHDASMRGRTEVAKLLLGWGAELYARAVNGQTPLDCAEEGSHADVYEYLRARARDTKRAKEKRTGKDIDIDADDDNHKRMAKVSLGYGQLSRETRNTGDVIASKWK